MLTVLLSSPRVAPGLLTWQAWSALRAASRVLAGSAGHPQLPALTSAGVIPEIVELPADVAGQAAFLAAVVAAEGPVVWLAPPGDGADAGLPAGLSAAGIEVRVLNGAQELPGAHLLDLVSIMDKLRVSCPWDREQTHASLVRYLLEEAYEAVETVEDGDLASLREELGDVLLQVLFHARIAAERAAVEGGFTIDDVADTLAAKLVRRHPHVFGTTAVSSAADVNRNWEEIKKAERAAKAAAGAAETPSVLDGVPFGQPALSLAAQLQRRAARAGLPVPTDFAGSASGPGVEGAHELTGERLGAELMGLVAKAQSAGLDPEMELRAASRRFADAIRSSERSGDFGSES
ncbi:MAG TPA: MazG family protein [Trebonia sp.]|nr:MazG family protein [Trebonia sp.]